MNKKAILILSLILSGVLLTSLSITFVQSTRNLQIPTEWYQTSTSIILGEQWSWDWTWYDSSAKLNVPYILYKRVGDAVFLTAPNGPMIVAYRVGQSLTWMWKGGFAVNGGPEWNQFLMVNGTISITFTDEDIPLTDEDNEYKGLRLLVDVWINLYRWENISLYNYLWQGWMHQHVIAWAPKGSRA